MDVKPGTPKQAKLNFYYFQKRPQAGSPGPAPANVNNGVEERKEPAVANETDLEEGEE